jgi:GDP-L-fucose synthase
MDERKEMDFFRQSHVLVTGGTGLIGRPLLDLLLARAAQVRVVSLDDPLGISEDVEFHRLDLTDYENCMRACAGIDYVFHLLGVKASPAVSTTKPASYFVPTLRFNTNMMEAAFRSGVKRYMFTSSIGVYAPAEIFHEDDVWRTFPSENDRFPGWAKRMGELQAEAYRIEHGWSDISIVRPANVYGPYDNFDLQNAMVVPSLIKRAVEGADPLVVWGDGNCVRDFVHARDVAKGMTLVFEAGETRPVNLGSGVGVSIRELVNAIVSELPTKPRVVWDLSKPTGDRIRVMDTTRARALGYSPSVSIQEGVREVIEWYKASRGRVGKRYDIFDRPGQGMK